MWGGIAGPLPPAIRSSVPAILSHKNVFITQFQKFNPPPKLSTYGLLLPIETLSRRFCGGVDLLTLVNEFCEIKAGPLALRVSSAPMDAPPDDL